MTTITYWARTSILIDVEVDNEDSERKAREKLEEMLRNHKIFSSDFRLDFKESRH